MELAIPLIVVVFVTWVAYRIGYDRGVSKGFKLGGDSVEQGYQMQRDAERQEKEERRVRRS